MDNVIKNTVGERKEYHGLNAMLKLDLGNGKKIPFEKDIEAMESYMKSYVKPREKKFDSLKEKINWLLDNDYYDRKIFDKYSEDFVIELFEFAHNFGFKYKSFLGAFKFYTSYALKTFDGKEILEGFEDRSVAVSLMLGNGNEKDAKNMLIEILTQRFQPATPTFLNGGKKQRGEYVSCFLLRMEDNMESIGRAITSALQLSKRGGGVSLLLTNLREIGAPIKKIENVASGVVPVMKILEDSFSYANQLGARQGAGSVYLNAHHPDILRFLDTKRENADEKIRIKTLSLGIVMPDITFELAKRNEPMYLFSPYDVEREYKVPMSDLSITKNYYDMVKNPNIKKTKISARQLFQTIAELQFESGYPYLLFEDVVNEAHTNKGWINMSNLCSEILQANTPSTYNEDMSYKEVGNDISCNLGSLNILKTMQSENFEKTIETAIRALTSVSLQSNLQSVPSIKNGNNNSHAIGLGQMNLHGYLASNFMRYGEEEALDFTNIYFYTVTYYALKASNLLAIENNEAYKDFETSKYASGEYFDKYINNTWKAQTEKVEKLFADAKIHVPTKEDWIKLKDSIMKHGIYNKYLQAVPPTGSISYINHSTASIHPVTSKIEVRKEGKIGRVYYPAPNMNQKNMAYFEDAYEIGYKKIIDTYAMATQHIDQAVSATLFFKDTATTRDLNKAHIYAWRKKIKTLYYIRLRQPALEGTEIEECVACTI